MSRHVKLTSSLNWHAIRANRRKQNQIVKERKMKFSFFNVIYRAAAKNRNKKSSNGSRPFWARNCPASRTRTSCATASFCANWSTKSRRARSTRFKRAAGVSNWWKTSKGKKTTTINSNHYYLLLWYAIEILPGYNIVVKVSTRHPSTHTKKRLEKEKFVQCERERATSYYKLLSHFVSTRIETINILVRKFYETGVCVRVWVGESQ